MKGTAPTLTVRCPIKTTPETLERRCSMSRRPAEKGSNMQKTRTPSPTISHTKFRIETLEIGDTFATSDIVCPGDGCGCGMDTSTVTEMLDDFFVEGLIDIPRFATLPDEWVVVDHHPDSRRQDCWTNYEGREFFIGESMLRRAVTIPATDRDDERGLIIEVFRYRDNALLTARTTDGNWLRDFGISKFLVSIAYESHRRNDGRFWLRDLDHSPAGASSCEFGILREHVSEIGTAVDDFFYTLDAIFTYA